MEKSMRKSIGIDFGGTSVKLGVVVGDKVIAHAPAIATQEYNNPQDMIDAIATFVRMLLVDHPEVVAIGMGMPGFVDFEAGSIYTLTNVAGWNNVPVRDMLQKATGLPVVVENDANCMAYAEWKLGSGKGKNHLVCLTLGTGVGSGIIVNGQMVRGCRSAAGELGQCSIDYKGRIGHYGNRGALEDYIGLKEISADARTLYASQGQDKAIVDCSPMNLERNSKAGDVIAQQVWSDMAQKLATALVNCCYLLNPEAFILGGGIAKAGDLILKPLKEYMHAQLSGPYIDHLEILSARFGNEAGTIGAATLAMEAYDAQQAKA